MSNALHLALALIFTAYFSKTFGQQGALNDTGSVAIPQQSPPPSISVESSSLFSFDSQTNLVSLLGDIRKLVSSNDLEKAEQMANAALDGIQQTEQNKFYLNQIRKEETKIYYEQAKLVMSR